MKKDKKKIIVLGLGVIGNSIVNRLVALGYNVYVADIAPINTYNEATYHIEDYFCVDLSEEEEIHKACSNMDVVVSCLPYFMNYKIINFCTDNNIAYFDLTEDIKISLHAKLKTSKHIEVPIMPHCGLAPGIVNNIAYQLSNDIMTVDKIKIRVGSLPLTTDNEMKYYRTWSPEGVINEYISNSRIIHDGQPLEVPSLDGLEHIVIDGVIYECFNTSGGLGTLMESFEKDKLESLDYKTIRYPGHRDKIKFLFDDFDLRNDVSTLVKLFKNSTPLNMNDVVIILITCEGFDGVNRVRRDYQQKIYGDNQGEMAIQKATASGLVAMVHTYLNEPYDFPKGFVKQEDIFLLDPDSVAFDILNVYNLEKLYI